MHNLNKSNQNVTLKPSKGVKAYGACFTCTKSGRFSMWQGVQVLHF